MTWTAQSDAEFRAKVDGDPLLTVVDGAGSEPAKMLAESRVDLIAMIRDGIPEPAYVPGGAPWLRAGKRYLSPAPAGVGKSLAWQIIAVTIVEHGGHVAILDVENGADEYARRLEDILGARDQKGELEAACQDRLSYHAWPQLKLGWNPDEWAHALNGVDLVIFDSSRMALSSVGLAEDKADDYSEFVHSLLVPLSRAGITTSVLDNAGYGDDARARGTSAKGDLNEVTLAVKRGKAFDRHQAGHLRLVRSRCRFADIPPEIHIHLGDGTYAAPIVAEEPRDDDGNWRPTWYMEEVSKLIESEPGLGTNTITERVGRKRERVREAIEALVRERYVDQRDGANRSKQHYTLRPFRADDEGVSK